ncbi:MAG: UDP-N-acetyl-D-mannosamine dehydrogenase [Gammaproteobacteria bacterium]|nr:UDP-N-acetyl-D-mannosamine dehydrogenase [Gammaproteobacteria bacterium]MCH9763210.1 UDP-N-acetyl-D-mannosamine dehydrogenase [Gammaproteobacteria bacterium]
MFSKISVLGLGYIGLPTAALFASRKVKVIGVDISQAAVETVNRGEVHFIEPQLDIVVHSAVSQGFLCATTVPEPADVFIIAVPTPLEEEHQPDISYVKSAIQSIAPVLKPGNLIILESTSPVGTTEKLVDWLTEQRPDLSFPKQDGDTSDISIAYCPERVLPGRVLQELVQNDRIIGGLTRACSEKAIALYQLFVEGECIVTNARTAEMCKLTENSFRDVNIAFANELSMICDKLDIDVNALIELSNHHPRVNILKPGPGVGGHCIAVDPWFIVSKTPDEAKLIRSARQVNISKPIWVIEKIKTTVASYLEEHPKKLVKDITIACLGVTFKADIDDCRESPALEITQVIGTQHPGPVYVVEPNLQKLPDALSDYVELKSFQDALIEADIIVKLVNHKQFGELPKDLKAGKQLINICG